MELHVVLWIQDALVIQQDPDEMVLDWFQKRIMYRIPKEGTNPELHHLVTRYLLHTTKVQWCLRYQVQLRFSTSGDRLSDSECGLLPVEPSKDFLSSPRPTGDLGQ